MNTAIPVHHAASIDPALEFYCDKLGFEQAFLNRPFEGLANPAYAGVRLGEALLHLSSFPGDGRPGSVTILWVENVDALYLEFRERGVKVELAPTEQTWGNREMYLRDPDGNHLRFAQASRPE